MNSISNGYTDGGNRRNRSQNEMHSQPPADHEGHPNKEHLNTVEYGVSRSSSLLGGPRVDLARC